MYILAILITGSRKNIWVVNTAIETFCLQTLKAPQVTWRSVARIAGGSRHIAYIDMHAIMCMNTRCNDIQG